MYFKEKNIRIKPFQIKSENPNDIFAKYWFSDGKSLQGLKEELNKQKITVQRIQNKYYPC